MALLFVYEVHQRLELVFRLETVLFRFTRFLRFFIHDNLLLLMRVMHLVSFNLQCNEISLHAFNHVVVGALEHHLEVMLVPNQP